MRCRLFDRFWLRRRKAPDATPVLSQTKRGKQRVSTKPTRHTLSFRRKVDWSGPAPKFAALGAVTCAFEVPDNVVAAHAKACRALLLP